MTRIVGVKRKQLKDDSYIYVLFCGLGPTTRCAAWCRCAPYLQIINLQSSCCQEPAPAKVPPLSLSSTHLPNAGGESPRTICSRTTSSCLVVCQSPVLLLSKHMSAVCILFDTHVICVAVCAIAPCVSVFKYLPEEFGCCAVVSIITLQTFSSESVMV